MANNNNNTTNTYKGPLYRRPANEAERQALIDSVRNLPETKSWGNPNVPPLSFTCLDSLGNEHWQELEGERLGGFLLWQAPTGRSWPYMPSREERGDFVD